jgi:hypothetical protein
VELWRIPDFIRKHHRTVSLNAHYIHGSIQKPERRIADHVSQENYHWRAFSSAERPCYCFRIWCKSDEKRVVTSIFMNRHTLSVPHRERYCSSVAVDCLCECADNILRGNVPLTKLQKEKLKRNKAGLRALTKKSFSLKQKKAFLQKGGFLGSLLAPIASVEWTIGRIAWGVCLPTGLLFLVWCASSYPRCPWLSRVVPLEVLGALESGGIYLLRLVPSFK